jgi:putative ABC transport system permease protein
MIRLALASLRFRAAAAVATFLAVLIGATIAIACGGLFESALRLNSLPQRLDGAPVVIAGPAGFQLPDEGSETVAYPERPGLPAGLAGEVATVPGVDRALPDVSFPATLAEDPRPSDAGAFLSGHDWTAAGLTPYTLSAGTEPRRGGEVVLDATSARRVHAQPGDRVDVVVNGQPRTFVVSGVARADQPVDAPALFFSDTDVSRFTARRDTVDAIGVIPSADTPAEELAGRLAERFPDLTILTGDDRGAAEFAGITASFLPLLLLSSVFGGMVILVTGIVVAATINLTVRQRERELALLRASGATPRQVSRMVVIETMVVAAIAVAGSSVLGGILGRWLFELIAERGVVPTTLAFRQGPLPFAAGAVLGLLVPWLASRLAARRAARTRPIQALTEAAIPPVDVGAARRLLAKILAAGMAVLGVASMFLGGNDVMAIASCAALLGALAVALRGPEIIDLLVGKATGAIRRVTGAHGFLAVVNTRTRAVQFASVLVPITLGSAIAFSNIYGQTTEAAARHDAYAAQLRADTVITSTIGGTTPGMLADIRATPGVATASALATSTGWLEDPYDSSHGSDPWPIFGIDAQERDPVLAMPVTAGSLADLSGNTMALPARTAAQIDVGVGDRITVRLGDGTRVAVRVVALLDSPSNYPNLVLPAELLVPHTTVRLPSRILVRAAPEHDPTALAGTIRDRLTAWPGVEVGGPDALMSSYDSDLGMQAWIGYLVSLLAIAYAAIASVNTLAVSVLARRREFGVQRLNGATRRQVTRMLFFEGAIIATIGLALGAVVSLFAVIPMAVAVSGSVVPAGPAWVFLAVVGATFLLVLSVTRITARMAMKRSAVAAVSLPDE